MESAPELRALTDLIEANPAPSREATTILALDLTGPWAASRTRAVAYGEPGTPEPAEALLAWLDRHRDQLVPGDPDHGLTPFLAYSRLAIPVAGIKADRLPLWATDPAMAGAWTATPPRGWTRPETGDILTLDGRLAALAHLASEATTDVRPQVQTLAEWLVGRRRAIPSGRAGYSTKDPRLRLDWTYPGPRNWWIRSTESDPASVAALLLGAQFLAEYEPPPPTEAELQEIAAREEILAQGRIAAERWRMRA
jgi:hypothetical protein